MTPSSPGISAYQRYGDIEVNYNTGIPNIAIPMGKISLKGFDWPISLSYHSGGNKVNDFASNVGLGWVLQASGFISSKTMGDGTSPPPTRAYNLSNLGDTPNEACDNYSALYYNPTDVMEAEDVLLAGGGYQPAINYLNMATMNHKFIENSTLPASDIKIEPATLSGQIIRDARGNKYTFGLIGYTYLSSSCNATMTAVSPLYALTRIDTYSGEFITFGYESYSYNYAMPELEIRQRQDPATTGRCLETLLQNTQCSQFYTANEYRLTQALSSNGQKVVFEYTSRTDNTDDKKLSNVYFYDTINGSFGLKYYYELQHSYFGSSGSSNLRLRLDKVKKNTSGESPEYYTMEYNATDLPTRLSKSVDLWGYYNGASNTHLVPSIGDRYPNLTYARASILTKLTHPTGGKTTFSYELNPLRWSGLRIAKIEDVDMDNVVLKRRKFDYTTLVAPPYSLNSLFEKYDKSYFFGNAPNGYPDPGLDPSSQELITCYVISEQSVPITQYLDAYIGGMLSYDNVNEYFEDLADTTVLGKNGKTEYRYNTHINRNGRLSVLPVPAVLTEKTTYAKESSGFSPVKKEEFFYEYTADPTEVINIAGTGYWLDPQNTRETNIRFKHIEVDRDCMEHPGNWIMPKVFIQTDFKFTIPVQYLKKVKTTAYQNSSQQIVNEETYDYTVSSGTLDPSAINRTNSDGSTEKEEFRYTNSDLSGMGYTSAQITAFNLAKTDNFIEPVWKKVSQGSSPVFENQIYMEVVNGKPATIQETTKPTGGADTKYNNVTQYDGNNNPAEILLENKVRVAYRYSGNRLPTAECYNCHVADFAFTSFNEMNGSNFTYTSGGLNYSDYYASTVSYSLSAGAVSVTGFNTSNYYILSGYAKSATMTITGATVVTSKQTATLDNGWVYFEKVLQPGAGTISISGSGGLDELRFYPANGKLTSMAYGELYAQVTAKTNERGNSEFYEYTADGRLKRVLDQKKNILKAYSFGTANGNSVPAYSQNFIQEINVKISGIKLPSQLIGLTVDQAIVDNIYFNGFGWPIQKVSWQGSPSKKDIVQPFAYDNMGRERYKSLPYASTGADGSYRTDALVASNGVYAYYNPPGSSGTWQNAKAVVRTTNPLSESEFERSAVGRIKQQGAVGTDWQLSGGHTVKIEYAANAGSTGSMAVKKYMADVDPANAYKRVLTDNGYYSDSELYLSITKNENWTSGLAGVVYEFKDKKGRIIVNRTFDGSSVALSTYYVYDLLGNLSFVLSPKSGPDAGSVSQTTLDKLCYQYCYDTKRRMIEKKLPGKGWEYMVFNSLDQLVLSQDALQRAAGLWNFNKYDVQGRIVLAGSYSSVGSRATLQGSVDANTVLWEIRDNGATDGYTNTAFPTSSISKVLVVNFYDEYGFPGAGSVTATGSYSDMNRGQLTGTKVYRSNGTNPLMTAMYYDLEGRLIESMGQNHLSGTDRVSNVFNFVGELRTSSRSHGTSYDNVTIVNSFGYDHMGRKKYVKQSMNGASAMVLASFDYNDLGQLVNKSTGNETDYADSVFTTLSNFQQNISYEYNERGWLKRSGSSLFDMVLNYQEGSSGQYTGNISYQEWGTLGSRPKTISYAYDVMGRLTSGASNQGFSESIGSYDKNGNIISLTRTGRENGTRNYDYDGNQLSSISTYKVGTYTYDDNGNAKTDSQKGITNIDYNYMNLPETITGGSTVTYLYDALGNKLRKTSSTTGTTDYIGGIHYGLVSGTYQIDFVQTEEGRALKNGGTGPAVYRYEFTLTDHLGNNRVTYYRNPVTTNVEVLESTDYYPFGLATVGNAKTNKYLYNSKELQEEFDLNDYGARFYDPSIGRWHVIDPKAEDYSSWTPYKYALDNPMLFIDPDGKGEVYGMSIDGAMGVKVVMDSRPSISVLAGGVTYSSMEAFFERNNEFMGAYDIKTGDFYENDNYEANANQGRFGKPNMMFYGVPVFFSTVGDLKNGAAFTLPGIGIFINPNSRKDNDLLRHEFGHWLIALRDGNKFFYTVDVPLSVLSAKFSKDHQSSWTEVRANDLSYQYFGKPADWNFKDYHVSDRVRYNPPSFFQDVHNKLIQGINQYSSGFSKW